MIQSVQAELGLNTQGVCFHLKYLPSGIPVSLLFKKLNSGRILLYLKESYFST